MNSSIIVKVNESKNLEIPPEIKQELEVNSEYEMSFNQEEIILKKITPTINKKSSSILRKSSGKSILRHAGTWQGNDFEECLQAVYDNRSQIEMKTF